VIHIILALLATAGAFVRTAHAQAMPRPDRVVRNVQYANGIVNAGDGSNRLFVVQQEGQVLVTEGMSNKVFLDISDLTDMDGEQGLLGLAFAPDYDTSVLFYVQYTGVGDGRTVVAEYQVSATDPDQADAGGTARVPGSVLEPQRRRPAFRTRRLSHLVEDGGDADDPLGTGADDALGQGRS
jgi:hypothetical protein